jgi:uncharacterized membrane protein YvbJ
MFCTKCGQQLEDNAKFCIKCGSVTSPSVEQNRIMHNKPSGSAKIIIMIVATIAVFLILWKINRRY